MDDVERYVLEQRLLDFDDYRCRISARYVEFLEVPGRELFRESQQTGRSGKSLFTKLLRARLGSYNDIRGTEKAG